MRWLWLWPIVVVVLAAPAAAQAQRNDDPVAALDALILRLLPEDSPESKDPNAWVEVSRLLPTACDQVRWLLAQVNARDTAPKPTVPGLRALAIERGKQLERGGHLGGCESLLSELEPVAPQVKPIHEITAPNELRSALEKETDLGHLLPEQKFVLLARGAPAAKLFAAGTAEDWDTPRRVLNALARTSTLPGFVDLRLLQQQLVKGHGDWVRRQKQPFANEGEQHLVTTTFQIAAACLDRALGLDAGDLQGASLPIPYPLDLAGWTESAELLKQANLWTWAALAATLAGSTTDAQTLWTQTLTVNAELWPAVGEAPDGWLARATDPARVAEPGRLPLTVGFRAVAHSERARLEADLLKQLEGADPNDEAAADRIFQTIQRAKAVELGLGDEPKPLDLAKLKGCFGGDGKNHVYLFVEFLTLRQADGGASRCGGLALYRPLYQERKKGDEATYADGYRVKILKPAAGPAELVKSALEDPGPPRNSRYARILIAPDGPPSPGWFAFEQQTLLKLTSLDTESWVVYLPSALALTDVWTREVTLRAWHRFGLQSDAAAAEKMAADANPLRLGNVASGLSEKFEMETLKVWFAPKPQQLTASDLSALMTAKREKQLDVLPMWVRK